MSHRVLVLHGPSLSHLGTREPALYGRTTLAEVDASLARLAGELGARVECRQTNHEGALVDWILAAPGEGFTGLLINPAAYTHVSLAIRDALASVDLPAVEVHLTNLHRREPLRRRSRTAAACVGTVSGFGPASYTLGLRALIDYLTGLAMAKDAGPVTA